MSKRFYNPLSLAELGRNAANALMSFPPVPLAKLPKEDLAGAGVYSLHYHGYSGLYDGLEGDSPIYVGKAEPSGKRQGKAQTAQSALLIRLRKHSQSIKDAKNLDPGDFSVRWLILEPIWIGLVEQILIAEHKPVWNVVIDGFGNNDPGKGRYQQKRSAWDTLHPGRPWASRLNPADLDLLQIKQLMAERAKKLGAE